MGTQFRRNQRAMAMEVLSERQNHRCCYCGVRTNENVSYNNQATVEHVLTKELYGNRTDLDNCVMACRGCNHKRNDMPVGCWLVMIARYTPLPMVPTPVYKQAHYERAWRLAGEWISQYVFGDSLSYARSNRIMWEWVASYKLLLPKANKARSRHWNRMLRNRERGFFDRLFPTENQKRRLIRDHGKTLDELNPNHYGYLEEET